MVKDKSVNFNPQFKNISQINTPFAYEKPHHAFKT